MSTCKSFLKFRISTSFLFPLDLQHFHLFKYHCSNKILALQCSTRAFLNKWIIQCYTKGILSNSNGITTKLIPGGEMHCRNQPLKWIYFLNVHVTSDLLWIKWKRWFLSIDSLFLWMSWRTYSVMINSCQVMIFIHVAITITHTTELMIWKKKKKSHAKIFRNWLNKLKREIQKTGREDTYNCLASSHNVVLIVSLMLT